MKPREINKDIADKLIDMIENNTIVEEHDSDIDDQYSTLVEMNVIPDTHICITKTLVLGTEFRVEVVAGNGDSTNFYLRENNEHEKRIIDAFNEKEKSTDIKKESSKDFKRRCNIQQATERNKGITMLGNVFMFDLPKPNQGETVTKGG